MYVRVYVRVYVLCMYYVKYYVADALRILPTTTWLLNEILPVITNRSFITVVTKACHWTATNVSSIQQSQY